MQTSQYNPPQNYPLQIWTANINKIPWKSQENTETILAFSQNKWVCAFSCFSPLSSSIHSRSVAFPPCMVMHRVGGCSELIGAGWLGIRLACPWPVSVWGNSEVDHCYSLGHLCLAGHRKPQKPHRGLLKISEAIPGNWCQKFYDICLLIFISIYLSIYLPFSLLPLSLYIYIYIYVYLLWSYYLVQVWPFWKLLSGPSLFFSKAPIVKKNTIK